jgi:hypothetical protein
VIIRTLGRFKWLAMSMLCLEILGVGLMIHFRQPEQGIGYVVMCQIFIAFGGGSLIICEEMAVMSVHRSISIPIYVGNADSNTFRAAAPQ